MANIFQKNTKSGLFLNLLVMVALVAAGLLLFFYAYLPFTTNHGELLKSPDLLGKTEAEVKALLEEKGLRYEIIDSTYNADMDPSVVLEQNPRAGVDVKINRKIYLTTNFSETPSVKIPTDLISSSPGEARRRLSNLGFIIGEVIERESKFANLLGIKVDRKELTRSDIKKGFLAKKGQTINLIVGKKKQSKPEEEGDEYDEDSEEELLEEEIPLN